MFSESKLLTDLSNDGTAFFEAETGYDVIIYAGEEPNVKEIHAHSQILCMRSQYFRTAFSNQWAEKEDGKFIFRKPNIAANLFSIIIRFMYCGIVDLKDMQGPDVMKLLIVVDELNIQRLISHIQEFMIEHQAEFLRQSSPEIIHQHKNFTDLWSFCLKNIGEEVFISDKFIDFENSVIESFLKSDDLNIDEIIIWESLLKWCLARLNIKDDLTEWNKEDITRIKEELQRFIPLIRFYNIDSKDFHYRIHRYKDILPQDLISDLLEFHLVPTLKNKISRPPPRKLKIDSTLVGSNHIPLFVSWIDRNSPYKDNNYEFKLIYHSSRDNHFHGHCDGKGATIWLATIQDSTKLIGGYNPLDWDGNGWKNTTDSFLFNFTDGSDVSTANLGYVIDRRFAVHCKETEGPSMGSLRCLGSNWSLRFNGDSDDDDESNPDYGEDIYPNIGIPNRFVVEVYEVFQVIKR